MNVSSGMGSLTITTDPSRFESTLPGLAYPSSKAALNMVTSQYAKAFPAIRINAVDPGYTATDLNGHRGTQTVEQGAVIIVRMATSTPDGPTGGYFDAARPGPLVAEHELRDVSLTPAKPWWPQARGPGHADRTRDRTPDRTRCR